MAKKKSIQILNSLGQLFKHVDAEVVTKHFAVHPAIGLAGWRATHIRAGAAIPVVGTKAQMIKAAKIAEECGINWDRITPESSRVGRTKQIGIALKAELIALGCTDVAEARR